MMTKITLMQSLLTRNVGLVSRALYHQGHYTHSTMNDLPVPQGDWQEDYHRKQSKYNAILVSGILMLVGTIGLAKSTGSIDLNFTPPKSLD